MHPFNLRPAPGALSASFPTASILLSAIAIAGAQVNEEINRSIWKQKFGVLDAQLDEQAPYAGWLSRDADSDGINNRSELIAGTNPFFKRPTEAHFRPPAVVGNPATLSLTFPTVPGKLYGVEGNMSLVETWTKGTLPSVVGDGTSKTLVVPKSAGKFFHLTVTDQTTQGDLVSDWAKHMLGLSPAAPIALQTSFDSASLAANLETQNIVSLSVIDSAGTQPADDSTPAGDSGLIRVTRSGFMTLGSVTVPISKSGTAVEGTDFSALPTSLTFPAGVNSLDVKITPLFNANRTGSATVILTLANPGSAGAGGNYTLGSPVSAGVTVYPASSPTGSGLTARYYASSSSTSASLLNFGGKVASYSYTKSGSTVTATVTYSGTPAIPLTATNPVALRFTSNNLTNTAGTYPITTANGTTNFVVTFTSSVTLTSGTGSCEIGSFLAPLTRRDATVDFNWASGSPDPLIPVDNFSTRWTGQVLPQYSQKYFFVARVDDGVQLWVNNQLLLTRWPGGSATDVTGSIDLQAGVPYDVKLEYYEATGLAEARLSWYSDDQAKQIIPTSRLFPTVSGSAPLAGNPPAAAPAITSPTHAVTILGAGTPFAMNLTSSNGGTLSASGLPPWLTLVNGVLSGTPGAAGIYQFTVTTTNSSGSSSVVMTLEVLATPKQLTRELWTTGVTGAAISQVPWTTPPTATGTVTTAEDTSTYGNNTGERLRGYFTAPSTGNYYFWIAASNVAELWISNDSEPVNKVRRASVTNSAPRAWNAQPSQKSQWLSLIAGKKYYIEALHNTGSSGSSNHLSVAWFLDATGNTASPIANGCPPAPAATGGILPSHVLSGWDNPPTTTIPGTLYVTNLQGAQGLGGITGTGGAFLRVNGTSAVLQLNYIGLTSGATSKKIFKRIDATTSTVIFDLDAQDKNYPALKTSDGGYSWNLQAADLADLNNGKVYLGISTLNHPAGELTGTFGKIAGSQTAPAVPAYPSWPDQHATDEGANSRFLTQATFGPSPNDMAAVKTSGYRPWIESQFTASTTKNVPYILENLSGDPQNPYGSTLMFNSWWKNSVTAPDQLRQRAAFALSEILVVSDTGPLNNNGRVLADYYDTLLDTCFGNFRDILKQVTLSPAMGVYLDMRGNVQGDISTGAHPNENYAREILQLFSAGLYRTWPDGTLLLDSSGNAIPTYSQDEITGFARVFTGWNWGQTLNGSRLATATPATNYLDPMSLNPTKHELGTKRLLDNVILPAGTVTASSNTVTDPASPYLVYDPVASAAQATSPNVRITNLYDINGLRDLEATFDNIMANSAVGPYICRQLIQRLVTSHPKPEYVHRVVRAFDGEQNVDGVRTGIRGDMKEVFRAILLDHEARSTTAVADSKYGKQREPLLRVTGPARAFPAANFPASTYTQSGLQSLTITTPSPHRLVNGESVRLANFVDSASAATQVPSTGTYTVAGATANSFTISNNATSALNYTVAGNIATIDASTAVATGDQIYVKFATGSLAGGTYDKVYTVGDPSGAKFTVLLASTPATFTGGACLIPKLTSGYNVTTTASVQSILVQTTGNHNLNVNDSVYLKFVFTSSPLPAAHGVYTVTSIAGPNSFRVSPPVAITNGSQGGSSVYVFPLKGSHWNRTGTVSVELSTWGIGSTPTNLNQTPLNPATVFNFFYPDYQYPGPMATAGMTTPEFQLTNDSNTMNLTNLITQGTSTNSTGNPNGYISFFSVNAITLDMSPYMTPAQTSNAGVPTLVNTLATLLTGGNLSSPVRTTISNFVANTTNFPYTTPTPTSTQMRDRVRAIVHLITISAEYAIQK